MLLGVITCSRKLLPYMCLLYLLIVCHDHGCVGDKHPMCTSIAITVMLCIISYVCMCAANKHYFYMYEWYVVYIWVDEYDVYIYIYHDNVHANTHCMITNAKDMLGAQLSQILCNYVWLMYHPPTPRTGTGHGCEFKHKWGTAYAQVNNDLAIYIYNEIIMLMLG